MIKIILVGFWACLTTLAAGYAMSHVRETIARPPVAAAATPARESKKTKEINVPKIRDGVVKGYVVAQLSYVVDPPTLEKKTPVPPDPFIVDEAFRYIYDDTRSTSTISTTFDLNKMTKALMKNVNARLNAPSSSTWEFRNSPFFPPRRPSSACDAPPRFACLRADSVAPALGRPAFTRPNATGRRFEALRGPEVRRIVSEPNR